MMGRADTGMCKSDEMTARTGRKNESAQAAVDDVTLPWRRFNDASKLAWLRLATP